MCYAFAGEREEVLDEGVAFKGLGLLHASVDLVKNNMRSLLLLGRKGNKNWEVGSARDDYPFCLII